jgi:hypothetical protein
MDNLPHGYVRISGKRNPPADSGPYYVMLRNGIMPEEPWPVSSKSGKTRFVWARDAAGNVIEDSFDIVAVKKEGK